MIAEQYAYFPALNATLNGTSAALLLTGRVLIAKGRMAAHRLCMIAAVVASTLFLACYVFFHYEVGKYSFFRPRLVAPGLLHDSEHARGARHGDRAFSSHHAEPRLARAL